MSQWIEVTRTDSGKLLVPANRLCVWLDEKSVTHVFYEHAECDWLVQETYDQVRTAIEKVGKLPYGSIICAAPTNTVLDVPDIVGPGGVE